MKLHWLLPGTVGSILMLSSPVLAAKLESWRFDANRNRLEINTNGDVQPQAQLIFNPTRLVIDLPGTQFGQRQITQPVGGAIRAIRVGQFNPQTARLVVELSPNYTLDPKKVKFVGKTGSRWTVQLPKPTRQSSVTSSNENVYNTVTINPPTRKNYSPVAASRTAEAQIQRLVVTGDGFFVRTTGGKPEVKTKRSRDRKTIFMDISGATVSSNVSSNMEVNKHGVRSIQFNQLRKTNPSVVRMTLRVDKNSPDWRATNSGASGLVILPTRIARNSSRSNNRSSPTVINTRPVVRPPSSRAVNVVSTIKSVEIADNGRQLLIRGDRPLSANSGWDRKTALFRIEVPNAKLSSDVKGPRLNANSPVLRVRLQQQDPTTVVIFIQPASGVQLGRINQVGQLLSLPMQRYRNTQRFNPRFNRNTPSIGLPPLNRPNPRSVPPIVRRANPTPLPGRPSKNGKLVVMIDPGHGGKDPGAIGIGGLQEKQVILPIGKRVAQILEQNGIQVVMTRKSDYFVTLPGRVKMAERVNADLFVSIHANSAGRKRPDVNGLETYYYDTGLSFARTVHRRILRTVNMRSRGVRKARFYVLRKTSMPAILVETGYLTGRNDVKNLRSQWFRNKMAEGIARGILDYLKQR
ncbi:N-acetylmuramoyl-L-alanine amidase [Calothrix rhizosoleniae]|uniref:N-acetylmuramoyl-L-alanine amidase n=1 Tax=Calothrix rhizosoleniae TaxID=888997 RepID=UPI000B4A52D5|nr:N-acetylmuramoyl-L-alanine amidase [Calothrix rhizosoleniae]